MKKSLKRRLVFILLGLMLVSWFISASVTFVYSSKVLLGQIDNQLELFLGVSKSVMRAISVHDDEEVEAYFMSRMQQEGKLLRISDVGMQEHEASPAINMFVRGEQIIIGENTPAFKAPSGKTKVFNHIEETHETWRVIYSLDEETDVWFAVGVNLNEAETNLRWIFGSLLMPVLILLPLTGIVIYYGTGHGIKPLRKLAEQIAQRTPESLAPISMDHSYEEIEPLISSLNNLLARLERALESEQRFTSNAAHEMQTPLAAIKTEVQLCQRMVVDDSSKTMLSRISDRVDRASHTVKQLLTLARLDPQLKTSCGVIDLQGLLVDVSAELGHIAADREIDLNLPEVSALVNGNKEGLFTLGRNILGNAFKYTPVGGKVRVEITHGDDICLRVINDCDEISPEDIAKLGDRFYRPAGSTSTGAGLGISMIERICEMHGGTFSYTYIDDLKQFAVEVHLPA